MSASPSPAELAAIIDHTVLKPDTDEQTVRRVVAEAREHGFASVCVNPRWVPLVASELVGSEVRTCAVVGFPLGATTTETKVAEAEQATAAGAEEIDMVIDIADAEAGHREALETQIGAIAAVVHEAGGLLKVILETALLSDPAKELACRAAEAAGADYVKTSTGFAGGGATVEDVELMSRLVAPRLGVKASGGVRSREDAERFVAAGATRLGASSSLDIVGAAERPSSADPGAGSDGAY
ncbi:MAG: deoxyribose-phosphate aldolase [Nesterenkonia sp.]|uniref:deoxyribose-phosphate aldolase n=1 Tax=Nesterenkonia marinintestina TaxID=2979865 RepID=UPI0021C0BFCB|nr:deoxyribose-phosphate aldolase [Nesterenkonia sp. GX14115]MDO5492839.1 deoxyribose-phosphate aldolase [Nesterenkonia sp.]